MNIKELIDDFNCMKFNWVFSVKPLIQEAKKQGKVIINLFYDNSMVHAVILYHEGENFYCLRLYEDYYGKPIYYCGDPILRGVSGLFEDN